MANEKQQGDLAVRIMTPEQEMWQGVAQIVSSKNSEGPFDILPGHANFITIVHEETIVAVVGEEKKEFQYQQAVISVQNDTVNIYANI